MARYRLGPTEVILRDDGACIPPNPDNRDWVVYQAWLALGNTPDPYVALDLMPTVTKAQMLLWLFTRGKTDDDVIAILNTIQDPTSRAQSLIEWKYRLTYARGHPIFAFLASRLGLTDAQLDAGFKVAAKL